MSSRPRLLVNAALVVAILLCAHATARGQQALALKPIASVADHSTTSGAGPTAQSASVGAHLVDARAYRQMPVSASARTAISTEAQRNVMIVGTLLVFTAVILGGENGLRLGAIAGLVVVLAAVS
jgi:hypothetical protein